MAKQVAKAKMRMFGTDKSSRDGRCDGFTLFELLAVLTIASISLGVMLHLMPAGAGTSGLKSNASQLAAELRNARIAAINRQKQTVVRIDPDKRLVITPGHATPFPRPAWAATGGRH